MDDGNFELINVRYQVVLIVINVISIVSVIITQNWERNSINLERRYSENVISHTWNGFMPLRWSTYILKRKLLIFNFARCFPYVMYWVFHNLRWVNLISRTWYNYEQQKLFTNTIYRTKHGTINLKFYLFHQLRTICEMKNKRFYGRSRTETFHAAYVMWNTTDFHLSVFLSNYKLDFFKRLVSTSNLQNSFSGEAVNYM